MNTDDWNDWKLDTLHHYIPCSKILRFTLGSSDGVGQTYPDGQSWQEPFPAIEYFPFPHNVGGPFLEQLKPAEQGAQIEGHAETPVLRWHACKTRNILKWLKCNWNLFIPCFTGQIFMNSSCSQSAIISTFTFGKSMCMWETMQFYNANSCVLSN
jgi:hypothetical protein